MYFDGAVNVSDNRAGAVIISPEKKKAISYLSKVAL
jgi:hypothetical protein